jgi:hypothetical protein
LWKHWLVLPKEQTGFLQRERFEISPCAAPLAVSSKSFFLANRTTTDPTRQVKTKKNNGPETPLVFFLSLLHDHVLCRYEPSSPKTVEVVILTPPFRMYEGSLLSPRYIATGPMSLYPCIVLPVVES